MKDSIHPELALDEERLEPRDWLATVRVTDRLMKKPTNNFARSEEKKKLSLEISRHSRLYTKEAPIISDAEYDALKAKFKELDETDEHVYWEDELEADQLTSAEEVQLLALTHYFMKFGKEMYKGSPRYEIEVLDIRERAIQRPRLILPGA